MTYNGTTNHIKQLLVWFLKSAGSKNKTATFDRQESEHLQITLVNKVVHFGSMLTKDGEMNRRYF